jgi:membrane-associated phospholipid phosphatase
LSWTQAVVAGTTPPSIIANLWRGLRPAERIVLAFLAYAVLAAIVFHLSLRDSALIAGLNLTAATVVVVLNKFHKTDSRLSMARDWFPAALILLAYRESGLFVRPDPSHHLDYVLILWDRHLLQNRLVHGLLSLGSPWLQHYLELSYLLCYPLLPLGLLVIYLANHSKTSPDHLQDQPAGARRQRLAIDQFWTAVLLATLTCYALYPFFPLTPPRVLFRDLPGPAVPPLFRQVNFWILDRYSVQACIFPSGHVAAVTATALSVRAYVPRLGLLFLFAAASIALATVYGRYHYAADAVAGALVGLGAFLIARGIHCAS